MKINGIVLNDIHFGVSPNRKDQSKRIYNELHIVKDYLLSNDINLFVIAGDYFDRKLDCTEPATLYAITFFKEISDICRDKKIKLRMIQGTNSHEYNQLSLFYPFLNDKDLDFRIIETAADEEIFAGFKVLYLPEEYPLDADEFYKEFKSKEYNAIFGHGSWDFISFDNQVEKGDRKDVLSAPVFKYEEWADSIKDGFISFGHIHSRNKYKKKIFYSGSFSRWDFSDISERGFSHFDYDIDTKLWNLKFIDNTEAPTFGTYSLKQNVPECDSMEIGDIQTILNEEANNYNFIKIDITGLSTDKIELLKIAYKEQPNISIIGSSKKSLLKEDEEQQKKFEKFDYIISRKLPIAETVKRYIKEIYNCDIDLDFIKKILEKDEKKDS